MTLQHDNVIGLFGEWHSPAVFDNSEKGFAEYLTAIGAGKYIKAGELLRPYKNKSMLLLPPKAFWPRGGALALVLDKCREAATSPVYGRYWWRPDHHTEYGNVNADLGGAKDSDHIYAYAVDVDFTAPDHLFYAMNEVVLPMVKLGVFKVSIGVGHVRMHLGLYSPHGQRYWFYDGVDGHTRSEVMSAFLESKG